MRRDGRRKGGKRLLAAVGLLGLIGLACAPTSEKPANAKLGSSLPAVPEVQVPDGTPKQLAAVMQQASRESMEFLQKPPAVGNDPPWVEEMRRKIFTGIKAAEILLAHHDADGKAQKLARQTKLQLLYLGAQKDRVMFEQRLVEYVDQLIEEDPQSEEAALGSACRLEVTLFSKNAPSEEILPLLVDYAKVYPNSKAGIELFRTYAKKLRSRSDRVGAIECYQSGLSAYAKHPKVGVLSRGLAELRRAEAKRVAGRKRQKRAADAKKASITRGLGNHRNGYFVIYAEENVTPPRHGGMYLYRYQYEVLEGFHSAVAYVEDLPEKWSWNLVRRFPEDAVGKEQAYALWKKLLREKRTGKG